MSENDDLLPSVTGFTLMDDGVQFTWVVPADTSGPLLLQNGLGRFYEVITSNGAVVSLTESVVLSEVTNTSGDDELNNLRPAEAVS